MCLRHQLSSMLIVLDKVTVTDHVSASLHRIEIGEDARIVELQHGSNTGLPYVLIQGKHCLATAGSPLDFWLTSTRPMDNGKRYINDSMTATWL